MGTSLCKPKYNRNDLLALSRDSTTYGITLITYTQFINSAIYIKKTQTEDNAIMEEDYIRAWNEWKDTQPSLQDLPDITTNIISNIIPSPIVRHTYKIPKKHVLWQRRALKNFYEIQDWAVEIETMRGTDQFTLMQNIDNFIHYILDHYTYSDIVQHIKEVYTPTLWDISQETSSKWRDIIIYINNSSHKDTDSLIITQNICYDKLHTIWAECDAKIII